MAKKMTQTDKINFIKSIDLGYENSDDTSLYDKHQPIVNALRREDLTGIRAKLPNKYLPVFDEYFTDPDFEKVAETAEVEDIGFDEPENALVIERKQELIVQGVEENKVQQLVSAFQPFYNLFIPLENEFNEFFRELGDREPEKADIEKAKSILKRISKVRIDSDKVKTTQKRKYLIIGNAIQGFHNINKAFVESKEEKLQAVIKFQENKRAKEVKEKAAERIQILHTLGVDQDECPNDIGKMSDDQWNFTESNARVKFNEKKKKEEDLENERKEEKRKSDLRQVRKDIILQKDLSPYLDEDEKNIDLAEINDVNFKFMLQRAEDKRVKQNEENENLKKQAEETKEELQEVKQVVVDVEAEKERLSTKLETVQATKTVNVPMPINPIEKLVELHSDQSREEKWATVRSSILACKSVVKFEDEKDVKFMHRVAAFLDKVVAKIDENK